MGREQMMQRMEFLLTRDELWRINITFDSNDCPVIQVDLHMMSCKEARKTLMNIIAMYTFNFNLDVIHGYNHGTAIKDMIRGDFHNQRVVNMLFPHNQGRTVMCIA